MFKNSFDSHDYGHVNEGLGSLRSSGYRQDDHNTIYIDDYYEDDGTSYNEENFYEDDQYDDIHHPSFSFPNTYETAKDITISPRTLRNKYNPHQHHQAVRHQTRMIGSAMDLLFISIKLRW